MTIEPDNDLLIFKKRHEIESAKKESDKPKVNNTKNTIDNKQSTNTTSIKQQAEGHYVTKKELDNIISDAISTQMGDTHSSDEILGKKKNEIYTQKDSRTAAKDMFCVWHSWRGAYAICDYCHRPFCFEDLTESRGRYYCLEDINFGPSVQQSGYNITAAIISGLLFFMPSLIFIYYRGETIFSMFNYINSIGLANALTYLPFTYIDYTIELVTIIIGFIAGISVINGSKKSAGLGIFASLLTFSVFIVDYLSNHLLFMIIIAIIDVIAFVLLIYSRTTYESNVIDPKLNSTQQHLDWPEVGNF